MSAALVFSFYSIANQSEKGEHFFWAEGTSAWPSVGILFFTMLLALHFIIKSNYTLRENAAELSKRFTLGKSPRKPTLRSNSRARKWNQRLELGWKEIEHVDNSAEVTGGKASIKERILDMDCLWSQYLSRGRFWLRVLRATPMAGLYFLALYIVISLIGLPEPHSVRGWVPFFPILMCTVVVFLFLLFFTLFG